MPTPESERDRNLPELSRSGTKGLVPSPIHKPNMSWRPIALAGYTIILLTFGVGGVWAAVAKLDEAVVAQAYVATETHRKTIEHYEGGIVGQILVKEGDHVQQNQVLFRLSKVEAEASDAIVRDQLDSTLATEARLVAERDQTPTIRWPKEFAGRTKDAKLANVLSDQQHQFDERRASMNGQINILLSEVDQLKKQIQGIVVEKDSTVQQVAYINEELVNLRALGKKQLVPQSNVLAMERERTRLEGVIGGADADTARAESQIGEVNLQVQQLKQKFQEDVAANLLDTRQKIADSRQRLAVAGDVLSRIEIRAPLAGVLQNLQVFSVGQVIRPGEPLVDLIPDNEPLVVDAQVSPMDIDHVYEGMPAQILFPAFHSRTIPVMMGSLQTVSHDRLTDDLTRQYYYSAIIALDRAQIPAEYRSRIRPGMPAEVIVESGSRTALNYLVSPLAQSLRKAFREPND